MTVNEEGVIYLPSAEDGDVSEVFGEIPGNYLYCGNDTDNHNALCVMSAINVVIINQLYHTQWFKCIAFISTILLLISAVFLKVLFGVDTPNKNFVLKWCLIFVCFIFH